MLPISGREPDSADRQWMTQDDLMRYVLDTHGLVRLTARAARYFRAAINLVDNEQR